MGASVATLTAALASNAAAIVRAEAIQSVSSDGTSSQQAALDTLYKERRLLQRELDAASADPSVGGSGMFARTRVTGIGGILG